MSSIADDTRWMDATDQAALVRSGQVSPLELLDAALERAERIDPAINALTYVWADMAREAARSLPDEGQPFRGVPFVLKDLHAAMRGTPMSNGNVAMKGAGYVCTDTTEHVRRFVAAGLVIFGRGNSPEFGSLPTTEPEAWGPTRNPHDTSRTAGGSSGGSAAAVAAGILPAAHASDGGGSIRIPASCCGLVGLKVSQGRVSMGPNRDETNLGVEHVVTRSVRDSAALLDATHGPGVGDRVIAPAPRRPYVDELTDPMRGLRVGILDHRPVPGDVDPEVAEAVRAAGRLLESLGHTVEPAWPAVLGDESFGARFSALWSTNMSVACENVGELIGREVGPDDFELVNWKMREYAQSTSATQYARAIAATVQFRRAVQGWWAEGWDLLLCPVLARLPVEIGHFANSTDDPMRPLRRTADFMGFTPAYNTSGQPAISLPLGWSASGVPIGVQLVAAYGREDVLINVAAQLEAAAPWAAVRPTPES